MIAGVAQLVVNVADLAAARAVLGGDESFRAQGLPNNHRKAPMQACPREALDMVHLKMPDGVAVELTRYHGLPPAGRACYRRTGAAAVEVLTNDCEASHRFWTAGMRFRSDGDALDFCGAHPALCLAMTLVPDNGQMATVDADGCVLVTLLTTNLERELERLQDGGFLLRSTAAWHELIASRDVHVAIVQGPGGELVELLEAPRR